MQKQYWAVCIDEGLMGFAYALSSFEAAQIAILALSFLSIPPQRIDLTPIGPRLFSDKIETGDC